MPRDTVFSTSSDDLLVGLDWAGLLADLQTGRLDLDNYRTTAAASTTASASTGTGTGAGTTVRGQRALVVHWERALGLVTIGSSARAEDGTDVEVPGYWVDLDWSQCNRLIKFLRNARDQAFGRPE